MTERKDDTMELPLDELEQEKPRRGPPPLPGRGKVEPAESTTPTEIPPPPSRPPARLGKSVLPPDPKTFKMKSPAEVQTGREKESSFKATRRLKFKPGELPFDDKVKPASSVRPSAPPPPTAAALRLSSKPPPSRPPSVASPPPLKRSTSTISKPPSAPSPTPSKPSSIRTAVTRPGGTPSTTTSVGEAAKVARIRFLEEELRDVKLRIADHTRRVTARLDALAVRVEKLEGTQARATLMEQRVDEMSEDLEEKLESLDERIKALQQVPDSATEEMVAPPPSLEELEARLLATLRAELDTRLAAQPKPASSAAPKKKSKAKDADSLTRVKGIGPASAKKLRKKGVESPAAVAAWSDEDIDALHSALGIAKKRLREWRNAAKKL